MRTTLIRHFRILAIIAAFAMPALMASEASARTCKGYYNAGTGKWSLTKPGARLSSRAAWRRKVINLHGLKWASWTLSRNRHYDWCDQNHNGKWKCRALARACKPL